jgi:outer membrane protein assembly factor BamD (BamD/ComL family)
MKRIKISLVAVLALLIVACNSGAPKEEKKEDNTQELYLKEIKRLEAEIHKSMEIDNIIAGQAIQAYTNYSSAYPNDSLSPDFLFKAAEIATAIKQYPQAVAFYENITTKYPNYKLIEESYFLQAAVLDNFINDDVKAKVIYEQLITNYPNSMYVNDAKVAIKNLGKSDEELIKEFEKKAKANG